MVAFARGWKAAAPDPWTEKPDAPGSDRPVQRLPVDRKKKPATEADAEAEIDQLPDSDAVDHWADQGTAGPGDSLPHLGRIQQAFGPMHDLSAIQAHQGGASAAAAESLSAEAFTRGNHVAFGGEPDLHTAAHEAAHVVQQRAGVQLKSKVSGADDEHERNADAVADRVVAGAPAHDLLPASATHAGDAGAQAVQRKGKVELDVAELQEEGEDVKLDKKQLAAAVGFNNKRWQGKFREQILGFLRGTGNDEKGPFTASDCQLIAQLQKGAGAKPDGMLGDASMSVLLNAGFEFSEDVMKDKSHPSGKPKAGEVSIEFWPGELENMDSWNSAIASAEKESVEAGDATPFRHLEAPAGEGRLYIKVNGKVIATYRARGGPPRKIKDFGGHTADPTQGSYTVGAQQKGFTTSSWTNSQIPWGARVRQGAGGYEYQFGGGAWKKDPGAVDDGTFAGLPDVDGEEGVKSWNLNDFGAMAYRLQGSPGFYLHTTPETEEASAMGEEVELTHSHGCIHLDPAERDEMIARGFLQPGVRFVCKKYTDQLLPKQARNQMMKQFDK